MFSSSEYGGSKKILLSFPEQNSGNGVNESVKLNIDQLSYGALGKKNLF